MVKVWRRLNGISFRLEQWRWTFAQSLNNFRISSIRPDQTVLDASISGNWPDVRPIGGSIILAHLIIDTCTVRKEVITKLCSLWWYTCKITNPFFMTFLEIKLDLWTCLQQHAFFFFKYYYFSPFKYRTILNVRFSRYGSGLLMSFIGDYRKTGQSNFIIWVALISWLG